MPKLYTYLGIAVFFYSNDHRPIHVHGAKGGRESVVEVFFKDGQVSAIRAREVRGKRPLEKKDLDLLRELARARAHEIADLWHRYFVLGLPPKSQTITRRLKP